MLSRPGTALYLYPYSVPDPTPTRLESLLELSARTSAANSDPYKDNLRVALLPYDLIFQVLPPRLLQS